MSLVNRIRITRKNRSHTNRISAVAPRAKLFLAALEDRTVPATITVNSVLDDTNLDSAVTLREAILSLNAGSDFNGDVTSIKTGTYGVNDSIVISATGTLTMAFGEFAVMKSMSISGPGAGSLTIDAAKLSRHFNVSDDTSAQISVSMSGMTLTNGQAPASTGITPFPSANGGSIYVRNDKLALDGMVITGNTAGPFGSGGGIGGGDSAVPQQFNSSGYGFWLTVNNSRVDNNIAPSLSGNGGGIYFNFPNSGVNFPGATGSVFIIANSTVNNNQAGKRGGGIYFSGNATTQNFSSFSMRNTTVSSNKALNEFGGGVLIASTTSLPMSITNSTITNNTGFTTPGGGGLVLNTGTGTLNLESSIIADNFGGTFAPDILANSSVGGQINSKNNIIGSRTGINSSVYFNNQGGTFIGSAKLTALAANGGIGATHLPAYNSPALNAGSVMATTITVAMVATDVSATVASTANLSIGSNIRIDNEVMLITNIAALVVSVTRAQNGTTAAAHTVGKAVNNGVTAITTLGALSLAGATTITVSSATNLAVGSFIAVDTELRQITVLSGSTVTVGVALANAHFIGAGVNLSSTGLISLATAIAAGDTSVFVANSTGIAPGMSLQADAEIVKVTNVTTASATTLVAPMTPTSTLLTVASNANLVANMVLNVDFETLTVGTVTTIATTLATAGINATQTNCIVTSATGIAVNQLLLIDSEYVLVTVASGTTIGITRGQNGTAAAAHSLGANVTSNTVSVSRGAFNTTAASHNSGVSLFAPSLTIVRAQNSTVAAAHVAGRVMTNALDERGNARAQGTSMEIGAVEVNPNVPAAIATLTNLTAGNATGTFTVAYSSGVGIDVVGTVAGNNAAIRITGPGGFDVPATFVSVDNAANGSPRTATYTFAAPGGTWDYTDNGAFAINVQASKVFDTAGVPVAVPAATAGRFTAAIGRGLVVTDASDLAVSTTLSLAITNADVTADVTDATNIAIGQYLLIDAGTANAEYVLVTNIAGNTLTITRAQLATTAVAHAANASVVLSTLRWAIAQANANTFVSDSITFNTVAMGTSTITPSATLDITDPVAINGPGITVDGASAIRIFHASGPGNMAVSLTGLTVSNGKFIPTQTDPGLGTGILADDENLTLTNCTFTGNTGGAAVLYSVITWGSLTISGSKFDSNTGGGVVSATSPFGPGHDVSITNSSITNNTGGGFSGRTFSFNVSNTTIAGNSGVTNGGGINIVGNFNSKGNSIINSTITGNSAANAGGGIYMYWSTTNVSGQRVLIGNTTIVGNSTNGGFQNKPGGGVNNQATTAYLVEFDNCIIGSNTNSTVPDFFSKAKVIANNTLISIYQPVVNGTTIINAPVFGFNNKFGTKATPIDPALKPLANNGGSTQTMLPFAGSPVVDSAAAVPVLSTLNIASAASGVLTVQSLANFASVGNYIQVDSEIMRVTATSYASSGVTLTAAINNSVTAGIAVSATTNLVVGEFITIDTEIVQITAKAALTIDVLRGQLGTTAAAHASAASLLAPTVSVSRGQLGTTGAIHIAGSTVTIAYTQPANDQRGAGFGRALGGKVDIGAVEVDPNIPAAVLTTAIPTIVAATPNPLTFTVTFTDDIAIDVGTILANGNSIFRVTGPNGYNVLATYVVGSISNPANGTPRTAQFQVSAPNVSGWTTTDNGVYTISIDTPSVVSDTGATFLEPHAIATFRVGIVLNLIVINDNDNGVGSLRNAIDLANNAPDTLDNITFDAAFFATPRTITMAGGELTILDPVNIVGPGAKFVTLLGQGSRIFTINTPGNKQVVNISGMTMTGGNGTSSTNFGVTPGGGAILNLDEALTINGCVITKNTTDAVLVGGTSYGGGILLGNALATLTLQNSTLSFNTASQSGGGLSVRYGCMVSIDNTTISNNLAGAGNPTSTADGGGISASLGASGGGVPTPTITLTNSSIVNNTAPTAGGFRMGSGVQNSNFAVYTVVNTTFSGNVAINGTGGAISIGNSALFTIQNCTITGNYALNGGGGVQTSPAGFNSIYGVNNGAFINTIVAGNVSKIGTDLGGGNSTTGFTMSFVNSIVGAVDQTLTKINNVGSQIGTIALPINAKLSPLNTNGGTSPSHALQPGSPALNAGTITPVVTLTTVGVAGITTTTQTTFTVTSVAAILANTQIQIDSEVMTVVSSTSALVTVIRGITPAIHAAAAPIIRPTFLAPPATDQRGGSFNRQIGTIDIGAIEVDPATPVATGTFATVTAPSVGDHTITVTFTDDSGMNLASIQNNSAVRITGPGGFNLLATYVVGSAAPGTGAAVETAKYSFTPPGGGWDSGDDGFYTVSVEPTQVSDGTNFVLAATVGTLQVAIPRSFVIDTTDDIDDGIYTVNNLSIREAIKLANASVGTNDAITFSPTVFATPQTITLTTGELIITDPVTITGSGSSLVTVDAAGASRILTISMTPAYWGAPVSISKMSFANGRNLPSLAGYGAGITDQTGNLALDSVDMSGNSQSSAGGAVIISTFWAGLTLKNSNIHGNTAFQGSGVYVGNNGSGLSTIPNTVLVTIDNTIFDSNVANNGALAGLGGANIVVTKSTFSNNTGVASSFNNQGGGIWMSGIVNFTLSNSSVTSNSVSVLSSGTAQGGGLFITAGATVTLSNDTITANSVIGNGGNSNTAQGGGIFVNTPSILTINGGTISGNMATAPITLPGALAGAGGGLMMTGASTVKLNNVSVTNNTAQSIGGGIFASALSSANNASGTLLINGSTISGNTASAVPTFGGGGGGIAVNGAGGMTLISNSTISGNSSSALGGGVLAGTGIALGATGLGGNVTIRNSTIAFNTADTSGGGINFNNLPTGTTTITMNVLSTIVSNNTAASGTDVTNGVVTTVGVRFVINTGTAGTTLFGTAAVNSAFGTVTGAPLVNAGANLSALGNFGGQTKTHALQAGSTALNTGSVLTDVLTTLNGAITNVATTFVATNAALLGVGQRIKIDSEVMVITTVSGTTITVVRGQDGTVAAAHNTLANVSFSSLLGGFDQRGNNRSNGVTDIGAFELQAPAKFSSVVINNGAAQRSMVTQVTVNFNQHVGFSAGAAAAFTLNRVSDSAVVNLAAIVDDSGSGTAVTLTFTGGAVDANSLADGRYALHILASGFNYEGFDGNGDGIAAGSPADDFAFDEPNTPTALDLGKIFRIFGDSDGDGNVAANDFIQFRLALGGTNPTFDFNNDGAVAANDFIQFRLRFGGSI